jgi:hypothetical protein
MFHSRDRDGEGKGVSMIRSYRPEGTASAVIRLVVRLAALLLVMLAHSLDGRAGVPAPGVDWRRTDWSPERPGNVPQTRAESGEDWWYDHKTSHDASQAVNGYVTAGYSGFVNYTISEQGSNGCLVTSLGAAQCWEMETPGHVKGENLATMALIPPNGGPPLWYRTYNQGWFNRVIQTSDLGYLAIGVTAATRTPAGAPLHYNPGQTPGAVTDQFDDGGACAVACTSGAQCPSGQCKGGVCRPVRHVVLVKTDALGVVQWQYLYGLRSYRDAGGNPEPRAAYGEGADGADVVETPTGGFRFVGNASDPSHTYLCNNQTSAITRAAMFEVDASGHWISGAFHGPTAAPSNAAAIARYGSGAGLRYVVSGTQLFHGTAFNGYTGCDLFQEVTVRQFAGSSASPMWSTTGFDPDPQKSQTTHDVEISSDTEILLPIISGCTGCLYSGYNSGEAKVFRLNTSGQVLNTCDLGAVTAYDLRLRVTPTADGGFAAVSTRRVTPLPAEAAAAATLCPAADTRTWNTDAYVAKCNACGNIEWETTFNVDGNAPASYPGDLRKQECLYSISQGPDGGFVVSGNNSYDFDDSYLAKLLPASPGGADLAVRDTPADVGIEPNPDDGPMWVSDDIWVRNAADGLLPHENPIYSATLPRYVYVRVHNRGCVAGSGELKVYWAKASTGLGWPAQWEHYVVGGTTFGDQIPTSAPLSINGLAPGASMIFAVPWHVPDPADFTSFQADKAHFCLLARIEPAAGSPDVFTYGEGTSIAANVRNNNNEAWKNVTIIEGLTAGGPSLTGHVILRNPEAGPVRTTFGFHTSRADGTAAGAFFQHGTLSLNLGPELLEKWSKGKGGGSGVIVREDGLVTITAPEASLEGIILDPGEQHAVSLHFAQTDVPEDPAERAFNVDLVQYAEVGGAPSLVGGERFALRLDDGTGASTTASSTGAGGHGGAGGSPGAAGSGGAGSGGACRSGVDSDDQMILCYDVASTERCDITVGRCADFRPKAGFALTSCVDLGNRKHTQPTKDLCSFGTLESASPGCSASAAATDCPSLLLALVMLAVAARMSVGRRNAPARRLPR